MSPASSIVRLAFVSALFALSIPATCRGAANLVVNGDFELGNAAFTSGYSYSPASNTSEAQYTVRTDPFPWNANFISHGDHTSGTGNMFVGNGDPAAGSIVWQTLTPIAVVPNTNYFFESRAMNVCCYVGYPGANSPALLEFSVLGNQVEPLGVIQTSLPAGTWQFLGKSWNSGTNTSVYLQIINQNTAIGGNDFALDDIHFSTTSSLPEPANLLLACMGLAAFLSVLRRR
jgi:hypothetical protein